MASWLRGHLRLSPGAANQIVRNGRTLEHLPAVAAACADGVVTAEQVAVLAPVTRPKNLAAAAAQGVDLAEVDAVLAETAATRQHVQLGRVVHHYLSRLDPDGTEPDPTEGRSLSIARHADGSRSFRGELDAVGGEKFEAMLESFVQADRPAGDNRTRAQQLADALVQAADVALASGRLPILRTVKPHVIVTIPLADLVDPALGPGAARTGFAAEISAARARWLACDGNVTRIVIGPEGQPMDLGRDKRVDPAAPAPRRRAAGLALRVRRLPRPQLLVRRPPPGALGRRRRDLPRQPRPALRTPPHQGPPRLHRRPRPRRPMAHLPPRRHRDPDPPAPHLSGRAVVDRSGIRVRSARQH